ncbi:MAG: class I SAM-dependent rRNA methyltransferase, partial [Nannocystaceae bacterium]
RLRAAWDLRQSLFHHADTNCYRLVNGEGDSLPGIIVDRYADYLCLKLDTPAWAPHLPELVRALVSVAAPKGIYLKGLIGELPKRLAQAPRYDCQPRVLWGEAPPDPVAVREYGMALTASLQRGQKTGLFLDQRENRALVRSLSHGRSVLNLFSYNGGFSIAAAKGGATRVISVDTAAAALADARAIFAANGFDPEDHGFEAQSVFTFLAECSQRFDLVVCDPPSFVSRRTGLERGLAAYTKLHRAAIRAVRPQGLLAAASCSSQVDMQAFVGTLREAASREQKTLRVLERRGTPADHPTPLRFPEGRYLKLVLAVVD